MKMKYNIIKPTWGLGRSPLEPISRGPGRKINLEEAIRLGWRRSRSASVSNRRARRAIPEASNTKEGDIKFPRKRNVGEGETVEYPSKRVSRRVITYAWERNPSIHSSIHSFIHPSIHSFIHPFIIQSDYQDELRWELRAWRNHEQHLVEEHLLSIHEFGLIHSFNII